MGRPLRADFIEMMNIVCDKGQLSQQVGFSKYKLKASAEEIAKGNLYKVDKKGDFIVVKLAKEVVEEGDVVVNLLVNGKQEPVLKIMRNIMETECGSYAFTIDEKKGFKFEDEGVSLEGVVKEEPSEPIVEEVVETPVVTTAKKSSKKATVTE